MVKPVVKPLFSPPLDHDLLAFPPFFARLLAFLKTAAENHCMPQTKRLTIRQHPDKYSNFFSTMVKPVVKPLFSPPLDHDFLVFPPFFARLLAFLKTAAENDCMLPNVARYQLRHTPMCEKYSIFRSISVSGQTCGQTVIFEKYTRECSAEKVSVCKAFRRF